MKNVAVLGSTGSIGSNTLKVLRNNGERFHAIGLAAGRNVQRLAEQAEEFRPSWVYAEGDVSSQRLPDGTQVIHTQDELCQAVAAKDVDIVLCAISGTAGLKPVLAAIQAGKDIALASKEVLVMAGAIVTEACKKSGSKLLPVDSEHCAIFQCIDQHPADSVSRVILTCSGGPFHKRPDIDLSTVTPEQALKHPTWSMGRKITIDSATLMNKGLEIIEAGWLFGMTEPQVEVVIHPQSIIHSMVEFRDASIVAQMGYPDMCLPIHYCLNYPERIPSVARPMDFTQSLNLTFEKPDTQRFPALDIAREAMRHGGAAGAVFNAANEVAVQRFCDGDIPFDRIPAIVRQTLEKDAFLPATTLDEILAADAIARRHATDFAELKA